MAIPFHMRYGSLICSKRLQSDRPKCWSMLVEAGEPRKHAEIGILVLGLIPNYLFEKFNFFYPDIAQVLLFQMRYGSLICSKKWLSDRPKCWGMLFEAEGITVLEWCENRGCLSLSVCHLAVSQSWASYHTSSERGDSGLPADIFFWNFFKQIGII